MQRYDVVPFNCKLRRMQTLNWDAALVSLMVNISSCFIVVWSFRARRTLNLPLNAVNGHHGQPTLKLIDLFQCSSSPAGQRGAWLEQGLIAVSCVNPDLHTGADWPTSHHLRSLTSHEVLEENCQGWGEVELKGLTYLLHLLMLMKVIVTQFGWVKKYFVTIYFFSQRAVIFRKQCLGIKKRE